jgi:hypothetical protein
MIAPLNRQMNNQGDVMRYADGITRRRSGRVATALLASLLVAASAACDSLLEVEIPGRVEESALNDPALAQTLVNSSLGQFECAYANYVATVGVLTEEYLVSSFFVDANIWGWRGIELRTADGSCAGRNASGFGAYTPLQQARYLADDAARRIETFDENALQGKTLMLAQLAAYGGYAYLLLGEGFCEMAIDQGPLMMPDAVLAIAEQRFTSAITLAQSAGNTDLANLAITGRARTRLNLGRSAEAAADAALIPEGFVWHAEYSEVQERRENRVFNVNRRNSFLTVAPAYRDLTVGGVADPRVPVADANRAGQDGVTPQWSQNKYSTVSTPIPMASWLEAQLIIAEALGGAEAGAAINRIRAQQALPLLSDEESANIEATVLEERRRQLFSEGQRLGDMLRNDIPFPTGTNHKGQTYGPTTCLPLPDQERLNNPNLRAS